MLTNEVFGLIMDHDPSLVFIKDADSVILYANAACLRMYPPDERRGIVGSTTIGNFSPEEAAVWLAEDRRALAHGYSEVVQTVTDHSGRRRTMLSRKIAFQTEAGERRILGIATDITELSEHEASLVRINDQLSRFTALAAHDLRSPLASIVSALNVIRYDRRTTLGPNAADYVDLATTAATSMTQQITALLSAARAEHRSDIHLVETDLNIVMEEVRFNLSALIAQTESYIHTARLPKLAVEPNLFRQLVQNLIENAIRYRADRRPPHVFVRYEMTGAHHVLSVEDNGVGIHGADALRVFELFEQGAPTGTGSGLGLSLCRRIAALHGGTIALDESFTEGCRILVRLPAASAAELGAAA